MSSWKDNNSFCKVFAIGPRAVLATLFLAATVISAPARGAGAKSDGLPERLTDELVKAHGEHGRASAPSKPAHLARLIEIARARNQLLSSLIESEPGEVLRVAVPRGLRQALPAAVRNQVEEEVEIDGTVEILHEDRGQASPFLYRLKSLGQEYSLHFQKDPPTQLQTGYRVRVRGVRVNTALALQSGTSNVQALASVAPNTFGNQSTLVILVNFRDNTSQPYDVATATNVFFSTASNFFLENSYQQTYLSGVVRGWYTIDMDSPATTCDYNQIAVKAEAAAQAAGVALSSYSRRVYAFPSASGCGWWGLGSVGGNPSRAWINGSLQLRVAAHELGHNLGLWHSHSLDCGSAVLGSTCTVGEYGDTMDIMGGSSYHYNSYQKERLGWLAYGASPPITTAQSSGSYSVYPYETLGNNPKALKILKSTNPTTGKNTYYYAECRRPVGFDAGLSTNANVLNGFVIHTGDEGDSNSSYLLDMTPETASWSDPALTLGYSFSDPISGVTITPEIACTNSLNGSIGVSFGTAACVHANPDLTIEPGSSQSITPNGSVTYTLLVKNYDNSGCSASNFNLSGVAPSGWSSTLGQSALMIAPGASANTTITLTAPAGAVDGYQSFSASATHGSVGGYSDTAIGGVVVVSSINVVVATDKTAYRRSQTVTMTATVSAGSSPLANATVNLTLTKPDRTVMNMTVISNASGVATYRYRIGKRDETGTWQVQAGASANGLTGSSSTAFTVR